MNPAIYDVAVIGAGPAGSTAAYYLARGGLRVCLLDKSDFPRDKTCGDGLTPRAVGVLDAMGVLPRVQQDAYRVNALTIRNSDEVTYRLELSQPDGPSRYILILPRINLDDILLRHAMEAGAEFIPHSKITNIYKKAIELRGGAPAMPRRSQRSHWRRGNVQLHQTGNFDNTTHSFDDSLFLEVEAGRPLECKLAIVAAGANISLLRKTGLLKKSPPSNLAARAYFENVEGLDDTIMLFFDGVERPGYGWVFPVGPGKANIGCGVFFDSSTPQPGHLSRLIKNHSYLQRILKHAKQVGPIKGYPLRTDFSPSLSGRDRILVVGEAVGLVNPITGEGIDYALESAQLAAGTILQHWQKDSPGSIHSAYRSALSRKFRFPFAIGHLIQRLYFRDGIFDRILRRIQYRPYLHRIVVDACFGLINPISVFTPRTLWEVIKPDMLSSPSGRPVPRIRGGMGRG